MWGPFGDFPSAGISTHSNAENRNEEKLIENGNVHVLKTFESQQKREAYAPSQTIRIKKQLSLNMNTVDWSGFPGAAHSKTNTTGETTPRRKSTPQKELEGGVLASIANLDRRKQAKEKAQSTLPTQAVPVRHRSRRQLFARGTVPVTVEPQPDNRLDRRGGFLNASFSNRGVWPLTIPQSIHSGSPKTSMMPHNTKSRKERYYDYSSNYRALMP